MQFIKFKKTENGKGGVTPPSNKGEETSPLQHHNNHIVLISTLLFIFLFLFLTLIFFLKSYRNYQLGEMALTEGNIDLAVSYYDYSIRCYSVLNKYNCLSANHLKKIAEDYEKQTKWKKSVSIYQILLSALSSVKTPFLKDKKEIEFLIQKVQQLRAKIPENEFL